MSSSPKSTIESDSSNLAELGESQNSDNLLCIKYTDVATFFAIEAMPLTDHYNYRSIQVQATITKGPHKPATLDVTGQWFGRFFDPGDIRYVERELLA